MKIALIHFGNEENLGLLFVGGELKRHKQEIKFFDAEMGDICDIDEWNPDFIFFSPLTVNYKRAVSIACKFPYTTTVFGGHHVTVCPESIRDIGVDIVVVGPVYNSIEQILSGKRGIIRTEPTHPRDLAHPARKEYYKDIPRMQKRYRKFMFSTLGCSWNCTYCSSSYEHNKSRFGAKACKQYFLARRPMEAIFAEAKEILKYPTKEIQWADDDFFFMSDVNEWLPEFEKKWEKEIGLPLYVTSTPRGVLRVDEKHFDNLKKVISVVGMGIQAARESSLKILGRPHTLEDIYRNSQDAYDCLRDNKIRVNLQAIVGLPIEDPVEDAIETLNELRSLGTTDRQVCSIYPLQVHPKTKIEEYCKQHGFATKSGDTHTGEPGVVFDKETTKRIKNICKFGLMYVMYYLHEDWLKIFIDMSYDDEISKRLSLLRYRFCVGDRLRKEHVRYGKEHYEKMLDEIMAETNLRY